MPILQVPPLENARKQQTSRFQAWCFRQIPRGGRLEVNARRQPWKQPSLLHPPRGAATRDQGQRSVGTEETLVPEIKLHVEIDLQNLVPAFAVGPRETPSSQSLCCPCKPCPGNKAKPWTGKLRSWLYLHLVGLRRAR